MAMGGKRNRCDGAVSKKEKDHFHFFPFAFTAFKNSWPILLANLYVAYSVLSGDAALGDIILIGFAEYSFFTLAAMLMLLISLGANQTERKRGIINFLVIFAVMIWLQFFAGQASLASYEMMEGIKVGNTTSYLGATQAVLQLFHPSLYLPIVLILIGNSMVFLPKYFFSKQRNFEFYEIAGLMGGRAMFMVLYVMGAVAASMISDKFGLIKMLALVAAYTLLKSCLDISEAYRTRQLKKFLI